MAKVLRSYGIPDKLVDAIHGSYSNTNTHLMVYLKSLSL